MATPNIRTRCLVFIRIGFIHQLCETDKIFFSLAAVCLLNEKKSERKKLLASKKKTTVDFYLLFNFQML